jgi:hypothetical protein
LSKGHPLAIIQDQLRIDGVGFGSLHRSPGVIFDRFGIDYHDLGFGMMMQR